MSITYCHQVIITDYLHCHKRDNQLMMTCFMSFNIIHHLTFQLGPNSSHLCLSPIVSSSPLILSIRLTSTVSIVKMILYDGNQIHVLNGFTSDPDFQSGQSCCCLGHYKHGSTSSCQMPELYKH